MTEIGLKMQKFKEAIAKEWDDVYKYQKRFQEYPTLNIDQPLYMRHVKRLDYYTTWYLVLSYCKKLLNTTWRSYKTTVKIRSAAEDFTTEVQVNRGDSDIHLAETCGSHYFGNRLRLHEYHIKRQKHYKALLDAMNRESQCEHIEYNSAFKKDCWNYAIHRYEYK